MHGVTGSYFFGFLTRKVLLLTRFLISLRVLFSQDSFMSSEKNLTSETFLGSGMKWETYEPDTPKGVNSCENIFYNRTKYLV